MAQIWETLDVSFSFRVPGSKSAPVPVGPSLPASKEGKLTQNHLTIKKNGETNLYSLFFLKKAPWVAINVCRQGAKAFRSEETG